VSQIALTRDEKTTKICVHTIGGCGTKTKKLRIVGMRKLTKLKDPGFAPHPGQPLKKVENWLFTSSYTQQSFSTEIPLFRMPHLLKYIL
jgi:hypothetical protein